jgi:hypothetical protein
MKSRERHIRKLIEQAGLICLDLITTGGNHYAAQVQAAHGAIKKFIFSASPSDHRADKNRLALLRRFAANKLV